MFTVMFVLHESPSLEREHAMEYWRTTHAEIARAIPGVRRYVQNRALGSPEGSKAPFLGIVELAFDDQEAFAAAAGSPEFAAALADVVNFADPEELASSVVESVQVL